MEKTRLIIQYSGYHESGTQTPKYFTILNIEGEVNMKIIEESLEKDGKLSSFRRKKDVDIFYMQAF